MYTEEDIYVMFRKAQSLYFSRPYRLPKDINAFISNRMNKTNREALEISAKWFNTKWKNIEPSAYFGYGFELMGKKFTYHNFLDRRVHNYYITRDKIRKRDIEINKEKIEHSLNFIRTYIEKNRNIKISIWTQYCCSEKGGIKAPIKDYLDNNIDRLTLTWIIRNKHIALSDGDKMLIPLIIDNYREYTEQVKEFKYLLEEIW